MDIPVINLSNAPGEKSSWNRPKFVIYLWAVVELLVIFSPWQVSSHLRVMSMRLFGSKIGKHVTIRPRVRIKFPWNLQIGDNSWIGEGVWIHNQDYVSIGSNVVVSQETMISTGTHAYKSNMALRTKPVMIEDGVWITSRCMILGGSVIRTSAVIKPMSVIGNLTVPANEVWVGNPARFEKMRF